MSSELTRPADILDAIKSGDIPDLTDRKALALRLIEQILNAEDEAAIFDTGGTVATRDLIGTVFELRDVQLMPGEIEDAALPVYVLLDCRHADGTAFVANSGATRIVGQAIAAKTRGLLPKQMTVVELAAPKPGQSAPLGLAVQ